MKLELHDLPDTLLTLLRHVGRYKVLLFFLLLAAIYGYMILQINNDTNPTPPNPALSQQVTAQQSPHIDKSVVQQLQQLQDNSVSVKALFNQARSNPFQ